jgi:hypothetical protein
MKVTFPRTVESEIEFIVNGHKTNVKIGDHSTASLKQEAIKRTRYEVLPAEQWMMVNAGGHRIDDCFVLCLPERVYLVLSAGVGA